MDQLPSFDLILCSLKKKKPRMHQAFSSTLAPMCPRTHPLGSRQPQPSTTFVDPVFSSWAFLWRWRRKKTFLHPKPGYVASSCQRCTFFSFSALSFGRKDGQWKVVASRGPSNYLTQCPDQTTITTTRRKHTTTK